MRDMYDMMSTEWQIQCAIGGCLAQESCMCLYEHNGRPYARKKTVGGGLVVTANTVVTYT